MATELVRVPVEDDSNEFIEVEVDRRDQVELASKGDQAATAAFSLASAIERAVPAIRVTMDKLRTAVTPDELCIELALKIGGETGVIFTRGSAEAIFTITATWRRSLTREPNQQTE